MREQSVNFDRAADYYDATRGFPEDEISNIIQFIAESAKLKSSDNLLEIGIGTGRISLPLSRYVKHIFGVDISHKMMKKLHEKQGDESVSLALADAEMLPFANNSFTAAFVSHVFHLVRDQGAVMRELTRVVKPESLLLHCYVDRHFGMGLLDNQSSQKKWQQARQNLKMELESLAWKYQNAYEKSWQMIERPYDIVYAIENRLWSATWEMSEEQLQARLVSLRQAIDEHFDGDMYKQIESEISVTLDLWQSPA